MHRTLTTKNYQAQNSNSAQAQVGKLFSTVVSDGLEILNANENEGVLGTIKMSPDTLPNGPQITTTPPQLRTVPAFLQLDFGSC